MPAAMGSSSPCYPLIAALAPAEQAALSDRVSGGSAGSSSVNALLRLSEQTAFCQASPLMTEGDCNASGTGIAGAGLYFCFQTV